MLRNALLGGCLLLAGLTGSVLAADDWRRPAAKEWPMVAGDWNSTRYSTLKQIDKTTVKQLGAAFTKDFAQATRTTPVVHAGRMYLTINLDVYALDARTGEVIWKHTPAGRINNLFKGVAVDGDRVYVGLTDSSVLALDAKTGAEIWQTQLSDPAEQRQALKTLFSQVGQPGGTYTGMYISAAPTVANGVVVAVMANGDYGVIGRVGGFDAKTGKRLWVFNTVPAPGEYGSDTWQKNDIWKKGGVGVWMTPVVDPDLGTVYFGTGNPLPYYAGDQRKGDNLFANTLVALDLKTGKRKWHRQLVHHDIWELDLATPLIGFTAPDGRKGLAIMRVDGHLFTFDRATGEPIIPIEERPVRQAAVENTAPTQPYPTSGDSLVPPCVDKDMGAPDAFELSCFFDPVEKGRNNVIIPSSATRVAPMAYNPDLQMVFVPGAVAAQLRRKVDDPRILGLGGGPVPGLKSWGLIAAFDVNSGKITWQKSYPASQTGGAGLFTTAGGLLFRGDRDGNFEAMDAKTGDTLWKFQIGGIPDGPPISYEIDGKQRIAFVTSTGKLWVFELGGTLPQAAAPAVAEASVGRNNVSGRMVTTNEIKTAANLTEPGIFDEGGPRPFTDEFQFQPFRSKTTVGSTVTWVNNGQETRSAAAVDGSWSTGPIAPGKKGTVTFTKPGTWLYRDTLHPFSFGEITIQ